jgi:hypothetical protein
MASSDYDNLVFLWVNEHLAFLARNQDLCVADKVNVNYFRIQPLFSE